MSDYTVNYARIHTSPPTPNPPVSATGNSNTLTIALASQFQHDYKEIASIEIDADTAGTEGYFDITIGNATTIRVISAAVTSGSENTSGGLRWFHASGSLVLRFWEPAADTEHVWDVTAGGSAGPVLLKVKVKRQSK